MGSQGVGHDLVTKQQEHVGIDRWNGSGDNFQAIFSNTWNLSLSPYFLLLPGIIGLPSSLSTTQLVLLLVENFFSSQMEARAHLGPQPLWGLALPSSKHMALLNFPLIWQVETIDIGNKTDPFNLPLPSLHLGAPERQKHTQVLMLQLQLWPGENISGISLEWEVKLADDKMR